MIQTVMVIPFVWQKLVYTANKSIFNYVPCDNDFEVDFAKFLDRAEDVVSFSKIVSKIGFFVEYRDVDVEHKDKRIGLWCEDATNLMESKWSFIRVDQEDFEKYRFKSIKELASTVRK